MAKSYQTCIICGKNRTGSSDHMCSDCKFLTGDVWILDMDSWQWHKEHRTNKGLCKSAVVKSGS